MLIPVFYFKLVIWWHPRGYYISDGAPLGRGKRSYKVGYFKNKHTHRKRAQISGYQRPGVGGREKGELEGGR